MGERVRARLYRSFDAFGQVYRHRDLRYLELALAINWTAENAYLVAVSVYAYDKGGATAVGLVGLIRMVPAGVAGLFGAVIADRYRREWLLRLLYLGRAILAGATAVAFFAGAPVAVVFAIAALLNILAVLLRPACWALVPTLSKTPEQLVACNVVAGIFEGLAWLAGPAIAAVLISIESPGIVFVGCGLSLLVAAACSLRVTAASVVQAKPAERRVLADTLAGVKTVVRDRHVRVLFALFGAQTMVRGALNVLVVVAAIELLDLGESGVGWLNSAYGVGGLIGAFAAFSLVGRRRLAVPCGVGLILWGAPIALVGVWPNAAWALVMLGLPGLGNAILDVSGLTLLQRITPNPVLGRVFGALEAQVFATVGLGSLLASGLVVWLGVMGALIATGVSLPVLALMAWPRLRAIDDTTVVPEEELTLLRGVSMFTALPAVALEHLAGSVERVSIKQRDAVFREGEAGDRFYVISAGEVSVSMGNAKAMTLGPGDCFGEIALLRGVPRTATVTARTDLELFSLASEPFLAAVSGNTLSTDAADRLVEERITRPQPEPAARPQPVKPKPRAKARPKPKRVARKPAPARARVKPKPRAVAASKRKPKPRPKPKPARRSRPRARSAPAARRR